MFHNFLVTMLNIDKTQNHRELNFMTVISRSYVSDYYNKQDKTSVPNVPNSILQASSLLTKTSTLVHV